MPIVRSSAIPISHPSEDWERKESLVGFLFSAFFGCCQLAGVPFRFEIVLTAMLDQIISAVLGEGKRANRWQRRLFDEFVAGRIPEIVKVPTGGGKTAIILIFLAALAEQVRRGAITLPRRLMMVVNRRTLVDQATTLANKVLQAPKMSTALRSVGLLDVLLSTLAEPSGRALYIHARLRRLDTKSGEKCGLMGMNNKVGHSDIA